MGLSLLDGVARPASSDAAPILRCAFVNNMPDSAFVATERQFLRLLDLGSGSARVQVRRYTFDGTRRAAPIAEMIADRYLPLDDLWHSAPDVVVVTGSEPAARRLDDEPTWPSLVRLLEWSRNLSTTVALSCLAAHAAVLALDDVERVRLGEKRSGVFRHKIFSAHPLVEGLSEPLVVPHSRHNDVPTAKMLAAGYNVTVFSIDGGWCVAGRRHGSADLVLFQGHPEYDASTLLREYRRDLSRFVEGATAEPPVLPVDCAAPRDYRTLQQLQQLVASGTTRGRLVDRLRELSFEQIAERALWPWRPAATRLYRNLLSGAILRSSVR